MLISYVRKKLVMSTPKFAFHEFYLVVLYLTMKNTNK